MQIEVPFVVKGAVVPREFERINPIGDGVTQAEFTHDFLGIAPPIYGSSDDRSAQLRKLVNMLLKVSQLLTAIRSPLPAVYEHYGKAVGRSRNGDRFPAGRS